MSLRDSPTFNDFLRHFGADKSLIEALHTRIDQHVRDHANDAFLQGERAGRSKARLVLMHAIQTRSEGLQDLDPADVMTRVVLERERIALGQVLETLGPV